MKLLLLSILASLTLALVSSFGGYNLPWLVIFAPFVAWAIYAFVVVVVFAVIAVAVSNNMRS